MFSLRTASCLLLCSAFYVSAGDQYYYISCTEQSFGGKQYQYAIAIDAAKIMDAGHIEKAIMSMRKTGGCCTVSLRCVRKDTDDKLQEFQINHPFIGSMLEAGTHELRATIIQK